MKCGSCRITTADAYSRIKDEDLLEVLKRLNPNRRYNPKYFYFCDACIKRAKVKQTLKHTAISNQNAVSFSVVMGSTNGSSNDETASSNIGRHTILRLHKFKD